jgi:hypothetical protein
VPAFSKSATASTDLIELAFPTPDYRIGDPAVDVGFAPASSMDTDPDLGWKCALNDLAVDSGSGQPGSEKDGFEADDTVWFPHGCAGSCWLFLAAADPDRTNSDGRASAFFVSSYRGLQAAENRLS